ncbi:MAG: 6-hydroxymethylpterin diphosphokinase MptE-like protein [Arcobacteraceae bacterium]
MSLHNAQEQLQNALVTTFLANLSFLNEYDNRLYQRVDSLSQAINSGLYKENYSLEFLEQDGDFDIYDKKNKSYMYNKKPRKYNRTAVNKVDFTSKGSFSILEPLLFQGKKFSSTFNQVEYFCNFEYANKLLLNDLFPYFEVFENTIGDYKFKKYKYIDKFVFVGTLLGRHIPLILEKTKAKDFFVCEQNLELFRLSLFVVDYGDLARDGNTVVFSIMDDPHIMDEQLEKFLTHKAYENYSIKYFTTDHNIESYFNHILTSILAHKSTSFNYHMMLENIWKNVATRITKYPILQFKNDHEEALTNLPVLFLAAGPSLHENIEWVKENKDRFIIVAIGATHKTLTKHGIIPDIITTLDPQYSVLNKKHFDDVSIQHIQNSFVFASINTDGRILNKFKKDNLFLFEVNKPLHTDNTCYKGFSVGEISASILLGLKFKNIYYLGLDFAINQKTGDTHTQGYSSKSYDDDYKNRKQQEHSDTFTFDEELVEIPGNLEPKVYSNRLFSMSANALSTNISMLKDKTQTIYNLSNHGAFIQGTIPTNIQNVKLDTTLNKATLREELNTFLHTVSKDKLSKNDQEDLVQELAYLENLHLTLEEFTQNPSTTFEEFNARIEKLIQLFFFPPVYCSFVLVVFIHFFNIMLQYVYYCLNTQNLQKEKEKLKNAENVFLTQLNNLLHKYTYYLKQI